MLGYIYSLLKEIDTNYNGEELDTLYFGGGTPSLIETQHLKKIINKFNMKAKERLGELCYKLQKKNQHTLQF
jgi:coproporphyrinogen III oxidase-like Fe-S oxidoreductase